MKFCDLWMVFGIESREKWWKKLEMFEKCEIIELKTEKISKLENCFIFFV